MLDIEDLREALNILMAHRKTVRTEIDKLEDLLQHTHWIEQAWAQVNSLNVDCAQLGSEHVKQLRTLGGEK